MINEITQNISPITALPDLLAENRPAAVNLLVEVELPRNSIEMKNLVEQLNTFKTEVNTTVEAIEIVKDEAEEAKDITVAAKDEALTAVATLQEGAIDDTTIAINKAFSNSYIQANYYDKTEVYNKDEVDTAISEATLNINSLTDKPIPSDTDNMVIQETGGLLKKVSFENLTKLNPNDNRVKIALNAGGNAPIYAIRASAYVNHQTNTIIEAKGISSIVDNGEGDLYFNLTTPSPDTKYRILATVGGSIASSGSIQPSIVTYQKSTTQFNVITTGATTYAYTDNSQVYVGVIY